MVYFTIEKVKIINLLFLERKRTRQRVTEIRSEGCCQCQSKTSGEPTQNGGGGALACVIEVNEWMFFFSSKGLYDIHDT